jgi:hypothetical protein
MRQVFDKVNETVGHWNATDMDILNAKAECSKLFKSESRFDMANQIGWRDKNP